MGINWATFDGSDWRRVPGKARRYINVKTGETISRRQFLQHYGKARPFGSLEKRAKYYASREEQLLRPARGRKSGLRLSEADKIVEVSKRKRIKKEKLADEKIARELKKKRKPPKKITISNFKKGKISRNIELPIDYNAIEQVRQEAEDSKIVFGYLVGANLITEEGEDRTFTACKLRSIRKKFTFVEYEAMIERCNEISYARLVSLFVHLSLGIEIARKRNKWKGGKRK